MKFLHLIKNLLLHNPVKVTFISITLFLLYFPFIRGIPDDITKCRVIKVMSADSRFITVYQRSDRTSEYVVSTSNTEPKYENNQFFLLETSPVFVLCVVIGAIGLIICVCAAFADGDDGWPGIVTGKQIGRAHV